ncbi:MAG: universal stress protein [Bacteroidota bacterium]
MQTTPSKKVLIALDYDPTALKVAKSGYRIAKAMNAEVLLLHVLRDMFFYSTMVMNMGPLQSDNVLELKDESQNFLDKTIQILRDETIRTLLKEGDFASSILAVAGSVHADIIIMGSHGHKWLKNIARDSVTERVLQQTDIPLFIIPITKIVY